MDWSVFFSVLLALVVFHHGWKPVRPVLMVLSAFAASPYRFIRYLLRRSDLRRQGRDIKEPWQ
jgi:hypothetical protein